jgi:protein-S-isoprenylcysteine O-methyltransferase Ste14
MNASLDGLEGQAIPPSVDLVRSLSPFFLFCSSALRFSSMRILISRLFVIAVVVLLFVSDIQWKDCPWMRLGLFLLATVLVGIGTLGRMWCSMYIAGRKKSQLVTTGPYGMCRNPLYFFSLLGAVGLGCTTGTVTIPLIIAVAFALYYPGTIKGEEAELAKRHGEPFQQYLKSVPAFFPKLSLLQEPQQYEVNPITFRKHLGSVIWFIWALGLMPLILQLIQVLHEHGLPTWLSLY